jgi:hypothetical protein
LVTASSVSAGSEVDKDWDSLEAFAKHVVIQQVGLRFTGSCCQVGCDCVSTGSEVHIRLRFIGSGRKASCGVC